MALVQAFHGAGRTILFTAAKRLYLFVRGLRQALSEEEVPHLLEFADIDSALVCLELLCAGLDTDEPFAMAIRVKLLHNLARGPARKLRYASNEIRSLG